MCLTVGAATLGVGGHAASGATVADCLTPLISAGTATVTCAYNGTTGADGSAQSFTVPPGITQATFDVFGGQGGTGFSNPGGRGGRTTATLAVTPGTVLTIVVAGADAGYATGRHQTPGGFGGGGAGIAGIGRSFGGGGGSYVRDGSTLLVAAGGGGGATDWFGAAGPAYGGAGGGLSGLPGNGTVYENSTGGGAPGTQTGGGVGLAGAGSGGPGQGGSGRGPTGCGGGGGGGGGGYFGGAGGGGCAAGGGGSGYVTPSALASNLETGVRSGHGLVTISWTLPDSIAPVASPTQSPAANAAGWNNSDVTVNWNWTDNPGGSGIDPGNCTTSRTSSGQGNPITLTATCNDRAGNTGNASYEAKVDSTRPTITASATTSPNAAGWYNGDVTVSFACADTGGSGIPVGACPADQVLSTEGAAVASTTATVTDAAGNTSDSSNVVTVKIDKTAPALGPVVTPNPVAVGATASVAINATDGGSGVAGQSCIGGTSPDTSTVGDHTVTCSATDNAGNTASATVEYKVAYSFGSFLSPLPRSTVSKAGAAIPVKFTLNGASGPLSPETAAALAASGQVRVIFSGPGTTGPIIVTAPCTWQSSSLNFLCLVSIPKGLPTGRSNPYVITAQESLTPNGAANSFFNVPGVSQETVYLK